jgi:hypothetical protein
VLLLLCPLISVVFQKVRVLEDGLKKVLLTSQEYLYAGILFLLVDMLTDCRRKE